MPTGSNPPRRGLDGDDVTIAYIGGGSREWAPKFVQDLALSDLRGQVRLYDTQRDAAERNARFGNWVQREHADDATGEWTYEAVGDRTNALDGADVVVLSTQYDPTETFVHDLRITKDYGIYGAVTQNIGPGGIMRAMRTIPVYRRFAREIEAHCPESYVFNFTNPLHFVTRALYDEYPEINAVGLCHEVLSGRSQLADLASEHYDIDAQREDVSVTVKGINHFTWIDEARVKGIDLWPLIEELADSERANQAFTSDDLDGESVFVDNNQIAWELFRRFGMLPLAGDRHLAEFAPRFLAGGKERLNRWGVKRTPAAFREKHWQPADSAQTTDVTAWMDGERELTLSSSHEVFDEMLEALAGGDSVVVNANLPNTGQVDGLEAETIVETNALVREGEIKPLAAGGFPRPIRALISRHVDTIETVVAASRTGDVDQAFQGFLIDEQVSTLQTEDARDLFAELIAAQPDYLDGWDLADSETLAESPLVENGETASQFS